MQRSLLLAFVAVLALACSALAATPEVHRAGQSPRDRSSGSRRFVRVIVQTTDPESIERVVRTLGGRTGRRLTSVPGVVAEVPVRGLEVLSAHPGVRAVDLDRPIRGTLERTAATIGARWVAENLGVDGTGIGVAIIDSGVTRSHDDLRQRASSISSTSWIFRRQPHDGYGHGTHVAGIIAGSGQHSDGARRGIAPGAHLVVLKTLDRRGDGYISNAIAALDYAIEQRAAYNIRVINLSVAAGVYESYKTDPLTLAAARAVDAGIVVVTAAGNLGRHSNGPHSVRRNHSARKCPVGADRRRHEPQRHHRQVAMIRLPPSARWDPSAIDLVAKPDLVAPGVGIESTADRRQHACSCHARTRDCGARLRRRPNPI